MGNRTFKIILTQGLNRQIRRMCEYLDYKVVSLKRIRIMNIHLKDLPVGKWRVLTPAEMHELQGMLVPLGENRGSFSDKKAEERIKTPTIYTNSLSCFLQ
jgi:23S rRNA pseudouridine2604 synthase